MTFLLLLFLIFILVPVVKVFLAIYRAKVRSQRMWQQFNNNNAGGFGQQQRSGGYYQRQQRQQPQRKKKKIGRDVGEYVDFEEISGSSTAQTQKSTTTKEYHEQQVTDVEWEDLP